VGLLVREGGRVVGLLVREDGGVVMQGGVTVEVHHQPPVCACVQ